MTVCRGSRLSQYSLMPTLRNYLYVFSFTFFRVVRYLTHIRRSFYLCLRPNIDAPQKWNWHRQLRFSPSRIMYCCCFASRHCCVFRLHALCRLLLLFCLTVRLPALCIVAVSPLSTMIALSPPPHDQPNTGPAPTRCGDNQVFCGI
jgi:hypothetical protein